MASDGARKRIEELEKGMREMALQLKALKESLPSASVPKKIEPQQKEEIEMKSEMASNAQHNSKIIIINKFQWKVMALEYTQKMNLPKPIENV
eukprot:827564_1